MTVRFPNIPGLLLGLIVLAVVVIVLDPAEPSAFLLFLGRFHPAVVHFPIGVLLLAAIIEGLALTGRLRGLRIVVPFVLATGAVGALVAVSAGYLLSLDGGYDEVLVSRHKWLGIVVMVLAFAAWALALAARRSPGVGRTYRFMLFATAGLVLVTAHVGGSLTRGPGYLTHYLPESVKGFVGFATTGGGAGTITKIDSALVYQDLIAPVLERRCVKCHGPSKSKGDLRLDRPAGIERGGGEGSIVSAGKPEQSELVRRITLTLYDEDVMPPRGNAPLDIGETELIRWWIAGGASFEARVADLEEGPTAVKTYLGRIAAPPSTAPSGIFAFDVPEPDTAAVGALQRRGLGMRRMTPDAPFLDVTARSGFNEEDLVLLQPLRRQIASLDLSSSGVTALEEIGALRHLVRLNLAQTAVADDDLVYLADLTHLEYLNLYGTSVSDAGLEHLADLKNLRALYLWQSDVTDDGAQWLMARLPKAEVNLGSVFVEVSR